MSIPFWCILLAWTLFLASKLPVVIAQRALPDAYDRHHPRDQQARLEGWGRRALFAHKNAQEAFAPFAAGVIVCQLGGGDQVLASWLCIGFVAARAVYNAVYIADLANVRSSVWGLAVACNLGLFVLPLTASASP